MTENSTKKLGFYGFIADHTDFKMEDCYYGKIVDIPDWGIGTPLEDDCKRFRRFRCIELLDNGWKACLSDGVNFTHIERIGRMIWRWDHLLIHKACLNKIQL